MMQNSHHFKMEKYANSILKGTQLQNIPRFEQNINNFYIRQSTQKIYLLKWENDINLTLEVVIISIFNLKCCLH